MSIKNIVACRWKSILFEILRRSSRIMRRIWRSLGLYDSRSIVILTNRMSMMVWTGNQLWLGLLSLNSTRQPSVVLMLFCKSWRNLYKKCFLFFKFPDIVRTIFAAKTKIRILEFFRKKKLSCEKGNDISFVSCTYDLMKLCFLYERC